MAITVVQLPPPYHRAFTPTHVGLYANGDSVGKVHKVSINHPETRQEYFSLLVDIYSEPKFIDIQSYIRALFNSHTQHVSYTLFVNYAQVGGTFTALRSAVQLGEKADVSSWIGKLLTDFDELKGYEGYPLSVNLLGDESGTYAYYNPNTTGFNDRFIQLPNGYTTYEIITPRVGYGAAGEEQVVGTECSHQTIRIRPTTDNVWWSDYRCQQYYIQDFTVSVKSMHSRLGEASGGGIVESESSTSIKATPLLSDIVFDAWYYNGIRREDLQAEQAFYPTENCTLEARFVLSPTAPVRWDGYQCQEVEI